MLPREILHVDMDAFFVSVEEVLDPSLKGKPVIVGGDPALHEGRGQVKTLPGRRGRVAPLTGDGLPFPAEELRPVRGTDRGVVAAASYAARKFGIHSAMPLARARRLCPQAIFLSGSHGVYGEFSQRIFAILKNYSPLVEPVSLDEAYVDLTGCQRLHGLVLQTAERIRNEIKTKVGINASIGIASNKLLAKIASDYAKPSGMLWIAPGKEEKFLRPLAVNRLPGVGPKSGEQLKRMGVRTIAHLTLYSRRRLEKLYGQWGTRLYFKCRGICDSPVAGESGDSRSISRETTLKTDSMDARFLESTLSYLTEKAALQLRASGLYARSVTLKLRTADFTTVTRSFTLPEPTREDHVIFQAAAGLFRQWFTRLTYVRLIGVCLSSLSRHPSVQEDLFLKVSRERWDRLYREIDRMRSKYGFRVILRANSVRDEE